MSKSKIKLSAKQQETVEILERYPNEMIMFNGWLTGGHGIKFNKSSVEALKKKGVIYQGKLTKQQ